MRKLKEKRQIKIHAVHSFFKHLAICGAGVKGVVIGNLEKAMKPCHCCGKPNGIEFHPAGGVSLT